MAATPNYPGEAVYLEALFYGASSLLPFVETGELTRPISHSQTPINPATNLVVTSQLAARNGAGAGNLLFKLQHNPSSRLQLEVRFPSFFTPARYLFHAGGQRRSVPPSSDPVPSP